MTDPVRPFFDSLAGKRVPGGCGDCSAEQHLDEVAPNVWVLSVGHKPGCPTPRASRAVLN